MTITIDNIPLALDNRGRTGPNIIGELAGTRGSIAQVAQYVRGTGVEIFDRLNLQNALHFTTQQLESDPAHATARMLGLVLTLPRVGNVKVTASAATVSARLFLRKAHLAIDKYWAIGATFFMSYTITGGKFEAFPPND